MCVVGVGVGLVMGWRSQGGDWFIVVVDVIFTEAVLYVGVPICRPPTCSWLLRLVHRGLCVRYLV